MSRDRYVDFLRAWAIGLVVLGHWLITALVREPGGEIRAPELLATVPWTQWLTLGSGFMPLFFLAGGHAAAVGRGPGRRAVRPPDGSEARALRLLLPAAVYSGLVLSAGIAVLLGDRVEPNTLELVGWAMAMQFWFLPVYLLLSALTPPLHAAHRRWGLLVPVAMGAVALVGRHLGGDGAHALRRTARLRARLGRGLPTGFLLAGRPADGASAAPGRAGGGRRTGLHRADHPRAVPGQSDPGDRADPSNTDPPSAAMLAWAVAQVGLCLLAAPAVRRLLDRERVWRAVRPVGGASMTLYLWHMLRADRRRRVLSDRPRARTHPRVRGLVGTPVAVAPRARRRPDRCRAGVASWSAG